MFYFVVLGNHDYRGNVFAQLSPALKQRDSKWLCLRSFIVNSGILFYFFICKQSLYFIFVWLF